MSDPTPKRRRFRFALLWVLIPTLLVLDYARKAHQETRWDAWNEVLAAGGWPDAFDSAEYERTWAQKLMGDMPIEVLYVPMVFSQAEFDRLARVFPEAQVEWTLVSKFRVTSVPGDFNSRVAH